MWDTLGVRDGWENQKSGVVDGGDRYGRCRSCLRYACVPTFPLSPILFLLIFPKHELGLSKKPGGIRRPSNEHRPGKCSSSPHINTHPCPATELMVPWQESPVRVEVTALRLPPATLTMCLIQPRNEASVPDTTRRPSPYLQSPGVRRNDNWEFPSKGLSIWAQLPPQPHFPG